MTEIVLSEQQQAASDAAEEWLQAFDAGKAKRKFFVLSGYAGTGKSFTANTLIERLNRKPAFMTYTGKAALVLRKYGNVPATTIHSRIYKPVVVSNETFKDLYSQRDSFAEGSPEYVELNNQINKLKQPTFTLNPEAFEEDGIELIVLDECSMVDATMLADLLSFEIPIIALGDPGQLPPINGTGALFSGLPDATLTEIRRQALDNPIIQWSMWARQKRTLPSTDADTLLTDLAAKTQASLIVNNTQKLSEVVQAHDIVLCWKNATRMRINSWNRARLGYRKIDPIFPTEGETIIFTKNDKAEGIFNGLFAKVLKVGELMDTTIELTVELETGGTKTLKVLRAPFEEYETPGVVDRLKPWDYSGNQVADFGYALTCHKAQGSQWDRVLVLEENVLNWPAKADERAQWLYTAITRAAKKVTILAGKID